MDWRETSRLQMEGRVLRERASTSHIEFQSLHPRRVVPPRIEIYCDYSKIERKMAWILEHGDLEIQLMRDGTLKTYYTEGL